MRVGLLPALGGGIRALATTGQASRLIEGYLKPYARAFDQLLYFSYLQESVAEFTDDRELLARTCVLTPTRTMSRGRRALTMPWAHAVAFRSCDVLRVFQVTGVIPALMARGIWAIPYVTTYGFRYSRFSRPGPSRLAIRFLERVGLRLAAGVIVPTEELRTHVAEFVRAERVYLIPNGVDTTRFTPAHRSPNSVRRILYVGQLEARKNLATLLTAAAKLSDQLPVRLTIIGSGPLREKLRAEAEALGVMAEFPGVVDHQHLPEHFRQTDVFVLPSVIEGHPKALIEAMASGLPCVASDCEGNRSLVADGETGLLFEPRSPEALAAALERVLGEEPFAVALGRRARDQVVRDYNLRLLVEREIQVLKQVAAAGR